MTTFFIQSMNYIVMTSAIHTQNLTKNQFWTLFFHSWPNVNKTDHVFHIMTTQSPTTFMQPKLDQAQISLKFAHQLTTSQNYQKNLRKKMLPYRFSWPFHWAVVGLRGRQRPPSRSSRPRQCCRRPRWLRPLFTFSLALHWGRRFEQLRQWPAQHWTDWRSKTSLSWSTWPRGCHTLYAVSTYVNKKELHNTWTTWLSNLNWAHCAKRCSASSSSFSERSSFNVVSQILSYGAAASKPKQARAAQGHTNNVVE